MALVPIVTKQREEWEKTLKSDPGTFSSYSEKEHLDFAEQEKKRFMDDFYVKKKPIDTASGVFGPENDPDSPSNAYIDEFIYPKEGGTLIKYYGCPFKTKGFFPRNVVWGMQLSKHIFSDFPRSIARYSKFLIFSLALTWLFNRKGFLNILIDLMHAIDVKVTKKLTFLESLSDSKAAVFFPQAWYNECEKEIERALLWASWGEGLWEKFFDLFTPWFKLFLYTDNTYKSRMQDALSEGKDLFGTLKILRQREIYSWKTWKFIEPSLKLALWTSPALKRISKKFFMALDRDKVKMDLDDWYFCLSYKSYNFKDKVYEERKLDRKQMNEFYKVVFLAS